MNIDITKNDSPEILLLNKKIEHLRLIVACSENLIKLTEGKEQDKYYKLNFETRIEILKYSQAKRIK